MTVQVRTTARAVVVAIDGCFVWNISASVAIGYTVGDDRLSSVDRLQGKRKKERVFSGLLAWHARMHRSGQPGGVSFIGLPESFLWSSRFVEKNVRDFRYTQVITTPQEAAMLSYRQKEDLRVEWRNCQTDEKQMLMAEFIRESGDDLGWDAWLTFLQERFGLPCYEDHIGQT